MPEFERPVLVTDDLPTGDVVESSRASDRVSRGLVAGLIVAGIGFGVGAEPFTPTPPAPRPDRNVAELPTRSAPVSVELPPIELNLPGRDVILDVGPSGYAAAATGGCDLRPPCTGGLAVSTDLTHWTRRPLPAGALAYGVPFPVVLGPESILLQNFQNQHRGWYSADGGRSWRATPTRIEAVTDDASGGRLLVEPFDQAGNALCDANRLVVYQRDSGERTPLRRQPDMRVCPGEPITDPDGRLWVGGLDKRYGEVAMVALSTDAGAHWKTMRLPATGGATDVTVTYAGGDVYALAVRNDPEPSWIALFVYAFDHWVTVWRPGIEFPGISELVVCPDGTLLSTWSRPGGPRLLFSPDGGGDWSADGRLVGIYATAVPGHGWYGWYVTQARARPIYSYDCRHWYGIPVG